MSNFVEDTIDRESVAMDLIQTCRFFGKLNESERYKECRLSWYRDKELAGFLILETLEGFFDACLEEGMTFKDMFYLANSWDNAYLLSSYPDDEEFWDEDEEDKE